MESNKYIPHFTNLLLTGASMPYTDALVSSSVLCLLYQQMNRAITTMVIAMNITATITPAMIIGIASVVSLEPESVG